MSGEVRGLAGGSMESDEMLGPFSEWHPPDIGMFSLGPKHIKYVN
jgi:hypothetical protein